MIRQNGLAQAFMQTIRRDCLLAVRKPMDFINPVVFGFLVVLMFPLGLGPAPETLAIVSSGLIWVVALLACLLATDNLYQEDYADGSLVLMLQSPQSSYFLIMARIWVHWLKSGLVISLLSPLFGLMLYLPLSAYWCVLASLLLGTVTLVFIGSIGAALTVGLKNGGFLLTLIMLPLYVPVLIFGVAAVDASAQGLEYAAYLALLGGFALLAVVLSPLAVQAGLRINLDAS